MNKPAEETLTLKLSASEYERLIKMVHLGNWMINGVKVKRLPEYDAIEEKVLKSAGPELLEEYAIVNDETGRVESSLDVETNHEVAGYINDYDNDTFWEELGWALAERDLCKSGKKFSDDERFTRLCRIKSKYEEEFENAGIENLTLPAVSAGKNGKTETRK